MLWLPASGTGPRSAIYGRTEAEVLEKYRALTSGRKGLRFRPGSLDEFVHLYFRDYLASLGRSPLTTERYATVWEQQLQPLFGALTFAELTPDTVQSRLNMIRITKQGELVPASASTLATAKSLLRRIVALASAREWCSDNKVRAVSMAQTGVRTPKERRDIVQKANAIFEASRGTVWEGPFWIMLTLGLRWGEVCGLHVSDLADGVLTIQRQRNNKIGVVPYPKKRKPGEHRVIGMPAEMAERLRGYINGDVWMFHGPDGAPIAYDHNDRKLAPFLKLANVDAFTMHDFRSAAIVNLYGRVDPRTYYELFGHVEIQQTQEYLDSSADRTREALQLLVNT